MMGKTGTGKTTLINSMINYLLGVDFEDSFRYKVKLIYLFINIYILKNLNKRIYSKI